MKFTRPKNTKICEELITRWNRVPAEFGYVEALTENKEIKINGQANI